MLAAVSAMVAVSMSSCGGPTSTARRPAPRSQKAASGPPWTGWLTNTLQNELLPIDLATGKLGKPIRVGEAPQGIAISPNARYAFVADSGWGGTYAPSYSVTPVNLVTHKALPAIRAGFGPLMLATDAPLGRVYVVDMGALKNGSFYHMVDGTTITPIDIATMRPLAPIEVGRGPGAIAIAPDGREAVVTLAGTYYHPSHYAVIVNLETGRVTARIRVGEAPQGAVITPNGRWAFVSVTGWPPNPASSGSAGFSFTHTVVKISLATNTVVARIDVGKAPFSMVSSPGGRYVYVADSAWGVAGQHFAITPIEVATATPEPSFSLPAPPDALAITRGGHWLEVSSTIDHHGEIISLHVRGGKVVNSTYVDVGLATGLLALTPLGSQSS
jgi:DNA-binding beta-propeller fold protein YncE